MSVSQVLEQIRRLSFDERYEVFARLRDEFDPDDFELTLEQVAELDRRLAEFEKDPHTGIPWEQVEAGLIDRRLQEHLDHPDDVIPPAEVQAKLDAKYRK